MKKVHKKLAYFGGKPIINRKFKPYNVVGRNEIKAVKRVINSGILTGFMGNWSKGFFGGKEVQKFEKYLRNFYNVKNAIVVNSWSSGLTVAVGALDINPDDEIIVSPWTFCATATAILHWNAIPIFADIEKNTFCIDPKEVKKKITKKTKAIISTDVFGHPSDLRELKKIIKGTNIKIITDSAHAPYSFYKGKITGTQADIGGFSLNDQKHITTGEGGIVVTNNNKYANRIRLLRNHGEAVVGGKKEKDISNILGFNFRMGEIEASIGLEQYKKLKSLIKKRNKIFSLLSNELKKLPGIQTPVIKKGCSHNYFIYPMILDLNIIKKSRAYIVKLLKSEGVDGLWPGYYNLHLFPLYQKKIAYGKKGFPWSIYNKKISYKKGICPIAESLHDNNFLGFKVIQFDLNKKDILNISKAFQKVWTNLKLI